MAPSKDSKADDICPASGKLSELDDKELVRRCQEGLPYQIEAYRELVRRYETLVYNACAKMIGNPQDAEEVCQDAFLQVYHKIDQFEGRAAFKTWLFRIVYNYCLARRASIAKRSERQTMIAEEVQTSMKEKETLAHLQMNLSENVHAAINKLEGEQRRIIILKFVAGLTLQEISEVLDIGLSATKMRLYRALDRFKEVYLKVTESESDLATREPAVGRNAVDERGSLNGLETKQA